MIQYQVMELDENHLKKSDSLTHGERKRVCFVEPHFPLNQMYETMEEALDATEEYGKDFTEYTIILRLYKTNY